MSKVCPKGQTTPGHHTSPGCPRRVAQCWGMARFQTDYTRAQRLAATRARATRGWSYNAISEKAAAGELEGAGRFQVKPNTIGKWCRADLADYQPERLGETEHAQAAIETARAGLLAGILAERDAWEKDRKAGQTDLPKAGRILRALADWERTASTEKAAGKTGQGNDDETQAQPTADDIVQALLKRSNGDATTAPTAASLRSVGNGEAERPPLAAS